jgi:hypothetical protein
MYERAVDWVTRRYPKEHQYMMRLWRASWRISRPLTILAVVGISVPALVVGFTVGKMMGTTNIINNIAASPTPTSDKTPTSHARLIYTQLSVDSAANPAVGDTTYSFSLHFKNTGEAAAKGPRLFSLPMLFDAVQSPKDEDEWMEQVTKQARNPDPVQYPRNNNEMQPGDELYFSSRGGFLGKRFADFQNGKSLLYIFAVETYSDGSSGSVATFVCVYYYKDVQKWHRCQNHNQIARDRW